ncbi:MAG: ferritin [Pseudomonadota bacterium]
MLNPKIEKILNEQINAEFYSAFLYLSMSAWFERQNLPGFAKWTYVQYLEETTHALKFFKYMNERGGNVKLTTIKETPLEWKSAMDVFDNIYKHEQYVTSLINNIVDVSIQEKDHATNNIAQWYVAEQVEEEANAQLILGHLKRGGDSRDSLFMLDKEVGVRVFNDVTGTINPTAAGA